MISDSDKIAYWELVEKTLAMLGERPELAHDLHANIEKLTADQQELFYNLEPLTVAGDLCGITQWSQQDIDKYFALQPHYANINGRSSELAEN